MIYVDSQQEGVLQGHIMSSLSTSYSFNEDDKTPAPTLFSLSYNIKNNYL